MEPVDVRVIDFESADGTRLEGDLLAPPDAQGAAVVCHPHPLYGGSRRDAVVAALSRALVGANRTVLRFDFRGTGGSAGAHDGGGAERDDLRAAIDSLDTSNGLIVCGYSFGADIALSVAHGDAERWVLAAPPLAVLDRDELVAADDPRPVDVFQPEHDDFNPPDRLRAAVADWAATTVHEIPGTDHFFSGAHRRLSDDVAALFG